MIALQKNIPDLVILDIKMPRMDGEELLKKLKKKMSIPIIFLTSKDDEVDELLGLKLGADDFVKKSGGFSIKVLIERIRVQLRKKTTTVDDTKNIISHGKLKLDPAQLECEWNGKALPDKLTTTFKVRFKNFQLLSIFFYFFIHFLMVMVIIFDKSLILYGIFHS